MNNLKYKVAVLGVGSIIMSDDGLGVRAAERLKQGWLPPQVIVLDTGTSIMQFLDEISHSRHIIAIDSVRAGGRPGTIYRLTGEYLQRHPNYLNDSHGLSLTGTIELARAIAGYPSTVIVYGVEPLNMSFGCGLSAPVLEALERVAGEVLREITGLLGLK